MLKPLQTLLKKTAQAHNEAVQRNFDDEARVRWKTWERALSIAIAYKGTPATDEARMAMTAHALVQNRSDHHLSDTIAALYADAAVEATARENHGEPD